jgi:hypothetical protein
MTGPCFKQAPFYEIFEEQRRQLKLPFESLTKRKRRDSERLDERPSRPINSDD